MRTVKAIFQQCPSWSTLATTTEHSYTNVITAYNLPVLPGVNHLLCSLWISFSHHCFSVDLAISGFSELLITCLIWLELLLSLPAWSVFYKGIYSPLEMPLHDMTSKEIAIPIGPVSEKKNPNTVSCHEDRFATPRPSAWKTMPLKRVSHEQNALMCVTVWWKHTEGIYAVHGRSVTKQ